MSAMPLPQRIWSSLQESVGVPVGIKAWVARHGEHCRELLGTPQRSGIAELGVMRWDRLGKCPVDSPVAHKDGELLGWRRDAYGYNSLRTDCPSLLDLAVCTSRTVTVDIQTIEGMANSKSELTAVMSMPAFAQAMCSDWIAEEISEHAMYLHLMHDQIRILRPETTCDHLTSFAWDGRVFLSNAGGSHHFATAQYMAAALAVDVPIEAKLYVHALNPAAASALCHQYVMVAVDDVHGLHKAMQSFDATYYVTELPDPLRLPEAKAHVLFLPRDQIRSRRVAEVLIAGGAPDVGGHLTQLVARQIGHDARMAALNRSGGPGFDNAVLRQRINQALNERELALGRYGGP